MARVAFDDFGEKETTRIYLAAELAEAKRVEAVLNANGIEYAVEVEPYMSLSVFSFPSEYKGAAFYVLSRQANFCKRVLLEAGLELGIQEESVE
jgi:hypothetical protein